MIVNVLLGRSTLINLPLQDFHGSLQESHFQIPIATSRLIQNLQISGLPPSNFTVFVLLSLVLSARTEGCVKIEVNSEGALSRSLRFIKPLNFGKLTSLCLMRVLLLLLDFVHEPKWLLEFVAAPRVKTAFFP